MILRSIRPTIRTVDGIQIVTCPEGTYYVGDPCYGASSGRWDAWLKDSDYFQRPIARDLGAWAVAFGTAYGDGTYTDNEGREYDVDAGLLGVIRIALENPVSIISSRIRKPDQVIQPWQFGHGETKATCLWLKGLPKLQPTNIVDGREARVHKMPPGPDRWKERSRTFVGIAEAMAEQWGGAS